MRESSSPCCATGLHCCRSDCGRSCCQSSHILLNQPALAFTPVAKTGHRRLRLASLHFVGSVRKVAHGVAVTLVQLCLRLVVRGVLLLLVLRRLLCVLNGGLARLRNLLIERFQNRLGIA